MLEQIKLTDIIEMLKKLLTYLLTKYKLIGISTLITTSLAFGYWYIQPAKYTASATFIVEEGASKGGGLSGLASQFGVDIGGLLGGGSASLFSGENIYEIMKSKLVIEKVLQFPLDSQTMADVYFEISGLKSKIEKEKIVASGIVKDSLLHIIYEEIVRDKLSIDKINKKASVVTISVNSPNAKFSKMFVERLLEETSNLYIEIKTGNLSRSIAKIQHKSDSLERSLNNIYDRSYINLSRPMEATNRDKTVTYTLYGEVIKNLETLKISLINQTPIIQILDLPKYPIENKKTGLSITLLIGFATGILLSSMVAILLYTEKKN